jgi:hypothetical protein
MALRVCDGRRGWQTLLGKADDHHARAPRRERRARAQPCGTGDRSRLRGTLANHGMDSEGHGAFVKLFGSASAGWHRRWKDDVADEAENLVFERGVVLRAPTTERARKRRGASRRAAAGRLRLIRPAPTDRPAATHRNPLDPPSAPALSYSAEVELHDVGRPVDPP